MIDEEEKKLCIIVGRILRVDQKKKVVTFKEQDLDLLTGLQFKSLKLLQKKYKYILQYQLF